MTKYQGLNMITCGDMSCWVIKGENGDVLIDTGLEQYRDQIETWLLNYNVKLILLTSGYAESTQNAAYFSELYKAPIVMSRDDLSLSRNNGCRPYYITSILGHFEKNKREMDRKMKLNPFEPDFFAEPGNDLECYGIKGIDGYIIGLDGFTKGTIGFYMRSGDGFDLYAGGAVCGYDLTVFPPTAESPKAARHSLFIAAVLEPDRILCSRGKIICKGDRPYKLLRKYSDG